MSPDIPDAPRITRVHPLRPLVGRHRRGRIFMITLDTAEFGRAYLLSHLLRIGDALPVQLYQHGYATEREAFRAGVDAFATVMRQAIGRGLSPNPAWYVANPLYALLQLAQGMHDDLHATATEPLRVDAA
jgi:hypothetical protein